MSCKLKKISIIIATVLLVLSSLSFTNLITTKAATAAGNDKITLGVTKNTASIPALMASSNSIFSKENLSVDVKTYDSTSQLNEAINNGTVNIAVTDLVNYASLINEKDNKGWKLAGTLPGYNGLVANKKYKSIKSLKGKTIALDKKDFSKQYLLNVLKKNKMKASSVKIQQIDSQSDRVSALKDGTVDAAVLEDPMMSNAKSNGGKILNRQNMKADNGNVLIINNKYSKRNATAMTMFIDCLNKEIKLLNDSGSYGMAGTVLNSMNYDTNAAKVLTGLSVDFKKVHKIKKSDFNKAFKYAKSHKLYKGKISYKAHTLKITNVK